MTAARDQRRAATLLELLVALTLGAALLAAVFAFLGDLLATRERLRSGAMRQASTAALFDRLDADLAMAIAATADGGSGVTGDASAISLLTRGVLADPASGAAALRDLQRSELRFDRTALRLDARRSPATAEATGEWCTVEGDVEDVRFRYHDGDAWVDRFDSTSAGGLPMAVEVSIWFARADATSGDTAIETGREVTSDDRAAGPGDVADNDDGDPPDAPPPDRPPDRRRVIAVPDARPARSVKRRIASRAAHARTRSQRMGAPADRMARSCRPQGFVLIAVMVVVGIAMLVVLGTLVLVRAETAAAATHERSVQSRALAWSGVQAIAATLDRQRDRILAGTGPRLDREITIYEAGGRLGIVRLVPFDEDGPLRAEAGRLDLNHADAVALAATGLVDAAIAERIVAARQARGGRFSSELELLEVEGVSPETLLGSLDRLAPTRRRETPPSPGSRAGDTADRTMAGGVRSSAAGLLDVVTVYGFEPTVQRDGSPRLRVGDGWSEALERSVVQRFGADFAGALRPLVEGGTLVDDAALVAALRSRNVEPRDWATPLDAFTAESGDGRGGRIDLNSAPYESLLALPGISPPQAAEIVRQRDGLSFDDRATPTWPLLHGVVDAAQYEALANHVTVRCWMWRVRFEAGEVDASETDGGHDGRDGLDGDQHASIEAPVVWEAVIDLTTPRWRVAYLRDATLLPLAVALAAEPGPAEEPDDVRRSTPSPSSTTSTPPARPDTHSTTDSPSDSPSMTDSPSDSPSDSAPAIAPSDEPAPTSPKRPATRPIGRWRT